LSQEQVVANTAEEPSHTEPRSSKETGLSRRGFLAGATTAAAYVALTGGTGIGQAFASAGGNGRSWAIDGHGLARGLAVGADRLVAVGSDRDHEPAVWTAQDPDSEWESVRLDDAFAGAELGGVHHKGGEFIILGAVTVHESIEFDPDPGNTTGGEETYEFAHPRRIPTVWRSTDGRTWTRRLLDEGIGGNATLAAAADDGTRLVAVGSRLDADSAECVGALVLYTDDGRTWHEGSFSNGDGALDEGGLTGVVAHAGTWAAVGGHIEGGTVWSSPDGASWSVWDSAADALEETPLQSIVAVGETLVAAGAGIADSRPTQFTSRDEGRDWRPGGSGLRDLNKPGAILNGLEASDGDSSLFAVGAKAGKPTIERWQSK
jgi:hypothetical protein